MRDTILAVLLRSAVALLFFLPRETRRNAERWLRGWWEQDHIERADVCLVSYGKSGRTWLRLMLSRFYQQRFELADDAFLEFDNLKGMDGRIPSVFFTHGNYLRNYTGNWGAPHEFEGTRVVLLVRDPRDVAVSQYHQWQHRMQPRKKWLNFYPEHGADVSLWSFVGEHEAGLTAVIDFCNRWALEMRAHDQILVVRYEDLRGDTAKELGRILDFLGAEPKEEELRDAVDHAAFENMRKLEEQGGTGASGRRMVPGLRGATETYKVRRARVGGYREDFDAHECARLDERVDGELLPGFGYETTGPTEAGTAASAAVPQRETG